jgi:hypothetical protein
MERLRYLIVVGIDDLSNACFSPSTEDFLGKFNSDKKIKYCFYV